MENFLQYIIPVLVLALLAAAWIAVQLLAKKMKTKNYIEKGEGYCNNCEQRNACTSENK